MFALTMGENRPRPARHRTEGTWADDDKEPIRPIIAESIDAGKWTGPGAWEMSATGGKPNGGFPRIHA
jgi:hypothetical protein